MNCKCSGLKSDFGRTFGKSPVGSSISSLNQYFSVENKLSFRAVAAGAALTTVAWCIASYGFAFYVNYFSKYHVIYGSLTSIIVLITWIYISSFVILFGGSINAFWFRIRVAKKLSRIRKASYEDIM